MDSHVAVSEKLDTDMDSGFHCNKGKINAA